jgi:putative inorganic carbon (HCO3(-)) transporter
LSLGTLAPRVAQRPPRVLPLAALALALGAAVASPPPIYGAALFGAALVLPAVLARPVLGLCLALITIPLSTEWSVGLGGLNLTLMEPAVALAAIAWLWRGARERSLRVWPCALLAAQLLVLALFVTAALGAESLAPSLKDTLKWLELVVVFVLTLDQARDAGAARLLLVSLLAAAALEASYGAFQFVTGRGPEFFSIGPFMRAFGHFNQPNPFAGYLATALPMALALAFLRRDPVARWARPAAVLIGAGIVLSLSRGAWLGIAVACAVMLGAASPRTRRLLVPLPAALLLLFSLASLGVLPAVIADRLSVVAEYFGPFDVRQADVTSENWAIVERMAHWQAAWDMFRDHPWLGVGPGNYATVYDDYFLPGWLEPLGHAHNYYLNLAAETGIVGLAGYLLVLGLSFRAAVQGLAARTEFWRAVALGVLGTLVAVTLHSAFDNLFVHGVSVQIGVLLALGQVAADQRGAASG